ncbi:nucleoside hydrolase [Sporobolomyces salmoneus]|uniref:nucleoside hydrolase n=1 Tax=Sporobolomyces salmoneus TaxID=183962 RepID=UPI00316B8834
MQRRKVWLDCDPGRDDLVAILLALHLPQIELVGLSSVHGNADIEHMTYNCVRVLCSFGTPEQIARIPVCQGAATPLVQEPKSKSTVHGVDGLGGVEGLLDHTNPVVAEKLDQALKGNAVLGIASALDALEPGEKLDLVGTGSLTNIALFAKIFPQLLLDKVERIILMGGAEGRGNKSPVAESNILCDAHAASIVFDLDLPVVICPLNLTHTALFTPDIHHSLLRGRRDLPPTPPLTPTTRDSLSTRAATTMRHTLSTNLSFFAEAYKRKYDMPGPPLHDALTIAYISNPELFTATRYRVDVELSGTHSFGSTVVDLWDYKSGQLDLDPSNWGRTGKNVLVLDSVKVDEFWREVFLATVDRADLVVPINTRSGTVEDESIMRYEV